EEGPGGRRPVDRADLAIQALPANLEPDVRRRTLGPDSDVASENHRKDIGEQAHPINLGQRPPDRPDLVGAQWVVGDHMEAEIVPRECLDALLHVGAAVGLAGRRQSLPKSRTGATVRRRPCNGGPGPKERASY